MKRYAWHVGLSRDRNHVLRRMFLAYALYRIGNSRSVRDSQQPFGHLPRRFQYGRADSEQFTMALVYFTQIGKPRPQVWCPVLTLILGLTFLGVKAVEYRGKFHDNLTIDSRSSL